MVRGFQNNSAFLSDTPSLISQLVWQLTKLQSKLDEIGVEKFQFMICDVFSTEVCLYYAKQGLRVMILSPVFVYTDATIPNWPSPVPFTGLSDNLTFLSRIVNCMQDFLVRRMVLQTAFAYRRFILSDEVSKVVNSDDGFTYTGVRVPLVMAMGFGLEYPKTRFPLTEYVGPLMMSSFPPLEDKLVEWLNNKPCKQKCHLYWNGSHWLRNYSNGSGHHQWYPCY